MKTTALIVFALTLSTTVAARPVPDPARSPPMGWNSWNWHGKPAINETIVRETIDAMVSSGLRDAGYNHVVVDGGWRDTQLGPDGKLYAHPGKFPGGMKALADYAHARGLKFGVHVVPGTHDCGGDRVGGFGHEEVQVGQFVEWGLDFIKLDKCKFEPGWTEAQVKAVYLKWSELLGRCGRDMIYSISAYEHRDWYPQVCHLARTTYDITCRCNGGAVFDDGRTENRTGKFLSVMTIAGINDSSAAHAGHGYWNDPDMLSLGEQGLGAEEQKSHFALWCIMTAPLMLGNDPRHMTAGERDLVLNREAIAIDQDPTEQGRRIVQRDGTEVWAKKLRDGRLAVLLLNRDAKATKSITFRRGDGGPAGNWQVRDVFGQNDLGGFDGEITKSAPPHGCWLLLISSQPD